MTTCPSRLETRPLRAPQEDRSALVDPPLDEAGPLVDENARLAVQQDYDVQGRPLSELSRQAREELLRDALRWTAAYRDVDLGRRPPPSAAELAAGSVFLAGHQPEMFHPGVWLKNFALGDLARRHGAVAVNLLIDSDTVKHTSLPVPGGSVSQPQTEGIPFDVPEPCVAYESRRIVDRDLFSSFGRRVKEQIAPLVADPLIEKFWPLAQQRMQQTENLGACLAQARHRLEGDWGLQTLEVPQSRICETEPFCWFMAHLLGQLPRLWETYNEAVRQYRRAHRIRSKAHPVPELTSDGPWLEAPLWVFSADNPRRRPLFVRQRCNRIVLSDRGALEIELPLSGDGDAAKAVDRLMNLRRRGDYIKIRSRALITTLWARLVLGDLFVHGIGGAKYDEVTDTLIERFFGLRPPGFLVLSATLHLPVRRSGPIPGPRVSIEQSHTIRRQLRELVYHPERFLGENHGQTLGASNDPAGLIATKARWIRTRQTPQNARARCGAIRRVNQALQPWVQRERKRLQRLQAETADAIRAEAVLRWREYGFCLYPEETFREFVLALLPKNA